MELQKIQYGSIQKEMEILELKLTEFLSSEVSLATKVASYLVKSGGKRIRPTLTILTGKAFGYKEKSLITLACAIELLHTASLIHDDVVDQSDIRRGKTSIHRKWDNAHGVLVGDFVYSKAFQLMSSLENNKIITILADSTNRISEGEILQLTLKKKNKIKEKDYFDIIGRKTAELFKASVQSATLLAKASQDQYQSMTNFAYSLGIVFQLNDDLLDYMGKELQTGKKIGKDFEEGKLTLPLIKTLDLCTKKEASLIRSSLLSRKFENFKEIRCIIESSGALNEIDKIIQKYSSSCVSELEKLPSSPYKQSLKKIVTGQG